MKARKGERMKKKGIRQDWRIDENSTEREEYEDGEREIRQDWRIDENKNNTKQPKNNSNKRKQRQQIATSASDNSK